MTELKQTQFKGNAIRKYLSVFVLLAFILFNAAFTKNFVSWVTFSNLFIQASKVALVALGMTLVIATGGIDISVGSAMGLGATISAVYLADKHPAGIVVSLVVVLAFGAMAGIIISKFKVLPLIATLASMYIMRGLAQVISGIGTVSFRYPALQKTFITPIAQRIPIHFFILLAAVVIMYVLVNRMKYGSYIEAYGNNPMAAKISGIDTTKVVIIAYMVCALFAWISGMMEIAMVSCADPSRTGLDMEIDAIASVVIGGTLITGGYPNIIGTVAGAFLLQLITMMANMNNITYSISLMIKAGIIVFALFFYSLRKK